LADVVASVLRILNDTGLIPLSRGTLINDLALAYGL